MKREFFNQRGVGRAARRTLLILSAVFALLVCMAGCGNQAPPPEGPFRCSFSAEETLLNNGYAQGLISALSSRYTFTQSNTLELDVSEEGSYRLTKYLTTETGEDDPGVRITCVFEGKYRWEKGLCTLKSPDTSSIDQEWGELAAAYGSFVETGAATSEERPGLAWYFSTPFIGNRGSNSDTVVKLEEDGSFSYPDFNSVAASVDGNAETYSLENTPVLDKRPLEGKTIYWLGSSVTYGAASNGVTMADYIAKRQGAICVKEAVSGTTLLGDIDDPKNIDSYAKRLITTQAFDKNAEVDAFVCQISTNDAAKSERAAQLGVITPDDKRSLSDFDTSTTLGAVEYIICYVQQTWDCPIVFYSGTWYGGEAGYYYDRLVDEVKKLESKWGITVLDFYHDADMTAIAPQDYANYMKDAVHPKQMGYLEWWTPKFEAHLEKVIG